MPPGYGTQNTVPGSHRQVDQNLQNPCRANTFAIALAKMPHKLSNAFHVAQHAALIALAEALLSWFGQAAEADGEPRKRAARDLRFWALLNRSIVSIKNGVLRSERCMPAQLMGCFPSFRRPT